MNGGNTTSAGEKKISSYKTQEGLNSFQNISFDPFISETHDQTILLSNSAQNHPWELSFTTEDERTFVDLAKSELRIKARINKSGADPKVGANEKITVQNFLSAAMFSRQILLLNHTPITELSSAPFIYTIMPQLIYKYEQTNCLFTLYIIFFLFVFLG